jgi:hypothetical protein
LIYGPINLAKRLRNAFLVARRERVVRCANMGW